MADTNLPDEVELGIGLTIFASFFAMGAIITVALDPFMDGTAAAAIGLASIPTLMYLFIVA